MLARYPVPRVHYHFQSELTCLTKFEVLASGIVSCATANISQGNSEIRALDLGSSQLILSIQATVL